MKTTPKLLALAVIAAGLISGPSHAEVGDFNSAVKKAVDFSPRVNAAYYNFEATREAERGARGGYFPSVDLYADVGREDRETPIVDFGDYARDATRFSITQMLFDGFATREEVRRLGYAKLSQYYELQRASQEVAFEGAQAYLDVMKFQQLVEYAKDNYVVHRQVYDRIKERTGGGVSQGVDLEQAAARIALAESNLVTELTNLHDVRTRFQRVIGELPAESLPVPSVPSGMIPELRGAALELAYEQSPTINAAIENLRSSQAALNSTNAPMMPRVDLRYRNEVEHDTDGVDGRFDEEALELVLSYNLFRGGADSARKREFYNLYNAAIEERKQACLNVRQEVMIAFNNVEALEEQVVLLDRNRTSQDKTRRAYRDQFDIGQRTLLDLLDSQNEYFDTQRAYAVAVADLLTAQASTLANMGLLLSAMDMDGLNADRIDKLKLDFTRDPDDENTHALCPPEPPAALQIDRDALFASLSGAAPSDGNGAAAVAALAAGSNRYTTIGGNTVSVDLNVLFEFNSSSISDAFDEEIERSAAVLRENPDVMAIVEGHTDSSGPDQYNQWLSERRANAVREVMITDHGVDPGQVTAVGYGESRPRASNDSEQGRQDNRRVELVLKAMGS